VWKILEQDACSAMRRRLTTFLPVISVECSSMQVRLSDSFMEGEQVSHGSVISVRWYLEYFFALYIYGAHVIRRELAVRHLSIMSSRTGKVQDR
jgi:hypothetical protein